MIFGNIRSGCSCRFLLCSFLKKRFRNLSVSGSEHKTAPNQTSADIEKDFKAAMRKVPQPVAVVTSALRNGETGAWYKRGVTCSSLTSVSLSPPIISFSMNNPSRMHDLLLKTKKFAVHVLAKNQVKYAIHFSKFSMDNVDQFEGIGHTQGEEGIPLLSNVSALLVCQHHSVITIGDHHVWYGLVERASVDASTSTSDAMLYYSKTFRSIGDETFLQAFEDRTLPVELWTHEAHLRMSWNYLRDYGIDEATPLIKNGIKKYNERNVGKIRRTYHETLTMFYIHMVADALSHDRYVTTTGCCVTFEGFIDRHGHLTDKNLLAEYYRLETIDSPRARIEFILPDKKPLP